MRQHIPREFIDTVLERTDIIDVITPYVPLKKAGKNFTACCPFHNENTPSFNINQKKQFYHCFGCGVSGNVISFLMDYDHMSFLEAIAVLAEKAGLEVPRQAYAQKTDPQKNTHFALLQEVSLYYQQQLREHPKAIEAIRYLKARGITGEIAKHFQMGYAPNDWDTLCRKFPSKKADLEITGMVIKKDNSMHYYDRFRDRIMFPIRNKRGQIIGFGGRVLGNEMPKYLNSPETPLFHKSTALYGIYEALQSHSTPDHFIIVEGYMDVIALTQYGITNAVATLGTATSSDHIRLLLRYTNTLIFCFDGDAAGRKAAWRAVEVALSCLRDAAQFRFVFLPEKDDPDSFIRREGVNAWHTVCQSGQSFIEYFFAHLQNHGDNQTVEGRSQIISLAEPMIANIPETHLKSLILERLAQLVRLDTARLQKMLKGTKSTLPQTKTARRRPNRLTLATALLVQNPELAVLIPPLSDDATPLLSDPDQALWRNIQARLKTDPNLTTGGLLETFRGSAEFATVTDLAEMSIQIPEEGLSQEFQGILANLYRESNQNRVQELMKLAREGILSPEQKIELQQLIKFSKMRGADLDSVLDY